MDNINLTKEQKVLLALLKRAVDKDQPPLTKQELEGVDWDIVGRESISQTVPVIAFESAVEYKKYMPQNTFIRWQGYAFNVFKACYDVLDAQREMIEILGDKYPYVILKGTSASSYYITPEMRMLGDVDFLINPDDRDELEGLFVKNGYQLSNGDHPNHVVFKRQKAHLEMHFEVAGVPYGKSGEIIKNYLKNAHLQVVKKQIEGVEFNAPTPQNHALILLLHMQHHLVAEGLGLRHLCDWAVFINNSVNEKFWAELIPLLKKVGLFVFACVMSNVCAKYLGAKLPAWVKESQSEVVDGVIIDILTGGNFGVKDKNRANSGMLISEHGKGGVKKSGAYNLAHALHQVVKRNKAVKKCIILYPFVYTFKAIKFLFLSLIGKRPSIAKMIPQAEKRKTLYEKLQIFETNEEENF